MSENEKAETSYGFMIKENTVAILTDELASTKNIIEKLKADIRRASEVIADRKIDLENAKELQEDLEKALFVLGAGNKGERITFTAKVDNGYMSKIMEEPSA